MKTNTKLLVNIALYRLALKQCENYNNEIPLTLYRAENDVFRYKEYFFKSYSSRREVEEQKLKKYLKLRVYKIGLTELKLENRAGVVNLDVVAGSNVSMYYLPTELTNYNAFVNESINIDGNYIPRDGIFDLNRDLRFYFQYTLNLKTFFLFS